MTGKALLQPIRPIVESIDEKPRRARARPWRARLVGILLVIAAPASSAEIKWPPGPYNYIALDQDLREALIELGRNTGVTVKASDSVRGRLRNVMPANSAQEFLRRLCDNFGLVMYFDGFVLHINTIAEIKTDVIPLGNRMTIGEANERLRKLGIDDPRYPLRSSADGVVSVSGPPPYLTLLRQTLGPPTPKEVSIPGRDSGIDVFRGGIGG